MAQTKNYGMAGIGRQVQLGKQGPHISTDETRSKVVLTKEDGTTLASVSGANAISSSDFVTKAQLDNVQTSEATLTATLSAIDSAKNIGTVPAGTKTVITTITVSTAFAGDRTDISVGIDSDHNLLAGTQHNDPQLAESFQSVTTFTFPTDTVIKVFPTFSNVTQGNATIVVSYY